MGALEITAIGAVLLLAVIVGAFGVTLALISLWLLQRPAAEAPEPEPPPVPVRLPQIAPVPPRVARPAPLTYLDPGAADPPTDELTSPDAPMPGTGGGGRGRSLEPDDSEESTEVFDQARMSQDFVHLFVADDDTTTSGLRKPALPPKPARRPSKG